MLSVMQVREWASHAEDLVSLWAWTRGQMGSWCLLIFPVGLAGSEVLGRGRSGRSGKEVSPAGAQGQGCHHFGLTRGFEDACQQGLCVW